MRYLATSHGLLDQPGTVAFLVIFGMGVILFFVFRSMAKHLRKINMAARAEAEAAARAERDMADGEPGPGDTGLGDTGPAGPGHAASAGTPRSDPGRRD